MPPKKKGPDMAFLAAMLKEYGGEGADQAVENVKPLDDAKELAERNRKQTTLEMEAVLKHQHYAHSLMFKTCARCKSTFQTNYCYVGYCSDSCRRDAFRDRFHVDWGRVRPATEFEYEEFAVVSPDKTKALYQWAKGFVESYESFTTEANRLQSLEENGQAENLDDPQVPDSLLNEVSPDGEVPDTLQSPVPSGDYVPQENRPGSHPSPSYEFDFDDDTFSSPFQ